LARDAVAYAQSLQVLPRRGSLSWSLSWTELGKVSVAGVVVALVLLEWSHNILVIIFGGILLFGAILLLSRRERSMRIGRARAAEEANQKLLSQGDDGDGTR
jgi:hypothetical protein